jgi:hypothetical protein
MNDYPYNFTYMHQDLLIYVSALRYPALLYRLIDFQL